MRGGAGRYKHIGTNATGGSYGLVRLPTPPRPKLLAQSPVQKASDRPRFLTDQELVAAFPKGSCFIAEVDGKKELVFLDPEVQRMYVVQSTAGSINQTGVRR